MKKLFCVTIAVFLVYFCLSCTPEGGIDDIQYTRADYQLELGRFAGLDEDTEWQIVHAYLKKLKNSGRNNNVTINDVWVDQYYGSYCPIYLFPDQADDMPVFLQTEYLNPQNHTVVAVKVGVSGMDNGTEQRDVVINIPGSSYPAVARHYDTHVILLWDNAQLYDMEKDLDYQNPLLAAWDFRNIINRHNGLDAETDAIIRESVGAENPASINMKYLGTYNGYAALTLYPDRGLTASREQIIDGVRFYFPYKNIRVIAWKDGAIYELEDLSEQGLVTQEDLVEMAYFHHAAAN